MSQFYISILGFAMVCSVLCIPLDNNSEEPIPVRAVSGDELAAHRLQKRFISPGFTSGVFSESVLTKMRTKRSSEEECEKLSLCKLHARSSRNFFAAYELYFVNKENARLWDHHARRLADCQKRFSGCYDE